MPSQAAGNRGGDGGAITMRTADHKETASFDKKPSAEEYRRKQKELVDSGDFSGALEMDVKDIQSKFGDTYDDAIEQLREYYEVQGKL
jgi:hypothetical protein